MIILNYFPFLYSITILVSYAFLLSYMFHLDLMICFYELLFFYYLLMRFLTIDLGCYFIFHLLLYWFNFINLLKLNILLFEGFRSMLYLMYQSNNDRYLNFHIHLFDSLAFLFGNCNFLINLWNFIHNYYYNHNYNHCSFWHCVEKKV